MNFAEKILVNSLFYNIFYSNSYIRWFLDFCELDGIKEDIKCLEIGCGAGFTSYEIKRRFRVSLTAIDYDVQEIRLAEREFGKFGIRFLQADGRELPFKDGLFELVLEMNALHHIDRYEEAVKEAYRVLKKGGDFYMLDISQYFLWPLLQFLPFEHFDGKFTRDRMIIDLENAGFNVVRNKGWNLFFIHAKK